MVCGATRSPLRENSKLKIHWVRLPASGQSAGGEITVESPIDVEFEFLNYQYDAVLNFAVDFLNLQNVARKSSSQTYKWRSYVSRNTKAVKTFLEDQKWHSPGVIVDHSPIPAR